MSKDHFEMKLFSKYSEFQMFTEPSKFLKIQWKVYSIKYNKGNMMCGWFQWENSTNICQQFSC